MAAAHEPLRGALAQQGQRPGKPGMTEFMQTCDRLACQ